MPFISGISVDSCTYDHARTLSCLFAAYPHATDMCRGSILVATLVFGLPSVRGWLCAVRRAPYQFGNGFGTRTTWSGKSNQPASRRRMSCSCAGDIDVAEMWPHLAGKQTCASEAAGKVIREAWARDTQNTAAAAAAAGDNSGSSTGSSSSSSPSSWSIRRSVVQYSHGDTALEGLFARPVGQGLPNRLPGVIVAHTAVGPQEDMILWKLDAIARLGYAAFALDMFGTGHALWDRAQSLAARRPITEDRSLMQGRAMAAVRTLGLMEEVDQDRIAAVGYCFGGMAVLDLVRMAARPDGGGRGGHDHANEDPRLKAVASLHGILTPILPGGGDDDNNDVEGIIPGDAPPISVPRVLVLHATADPFVPPEQVQAMEEDFARFGASVEVVRYGGEAKHAFTRPEKTEQEDRDAGLSYCKHADDDSWRRVVALLEEELKQ